LAVTGGVTLVSAAD